LKKGNLQAYGHALLRIVAGFTFSLHGFQKLFGLFGGLGGHGATAAAFSKMWFAGALECFGGLLILVGLYTMPVAFVLCGEMAVAYFTSHAPRGLWPILNGGELAVLYCFIFLFLMVSGAGPWSIDRIVRKKA
jgi:putative oxidoreductase